MKPEKPSHLAESRTSSIKGPRSLKRFLPAVSTETTTAQSEAMEKGTKFLSLAANNHSQITINSATSISIGKSQNFHLAIETHPISSRMIKPKPKTPRALSKASSRLT